MTKIVKNWLNLKSDRRGVTALEYGLIAAVIAVVLIAGAGLLGNSINNTFAGVSKKMDTAVARSP